MSKRRRRKRKHRGQPLVAHVSDSGLPLNLGEVFLLLTRGDWQGVLRFLVVLVAIVGAVSLLLLVSTKLGVPTWASGVATIMGGAALGMKALRKRKGS